MTTRMNVIIADAPKDADCIILCVHRTLVTMSCLTNASEYKESWEGHLQKKKKHSKNIHVHVANHFQIPPTAVQMFLFLHKTIQNN